MGSVRCSIWLYRCLRNRIDHRGGGKLVTALIFAVYFAALAALEIKISLLNAFVLATVAATYFKGAVVRRDSYVLVASLIASCFAALMLLVYAVTGEFSYAVFAFISAPLLFLKIRP